MIMKKFYTIFISISVIVLCVTFSSCTKDGVYNPKEKISKIFYESSYSDGKQLSEIWSWNKKTLSSIKDVDGDFVNFEYDGKRLTTARSSSGSRIEFTYDGLKIKKIESYNSSNQLSYSMEYIHDGTKISQINGSYFSNSSYKSSNENEFLSGLNFIFPDPTVNQRIKKTVKKQIEKSGAKASVSTYTVKVIWDGSNIKELTSESYSGDYYSQTYTYTYDKKLNPYYRSMFILYNTDTPTSKNNVLSYTYTDSEGDYESGNYTYEYDGKYPIKQMNYGTDGYYAFIYYEYVE